MARVEIIFDGEDKASGTIKKVEAGVVDLGKQVDNTEKKSKGLWSSLGGIGKTAALGGIGLAVTGVVALGGALASGIADAREAAGIMAQTEAVIKSTGGAAGFTAEQIAEMSGALSAAEGKSLFGDSDIQKGQNLLLTFTEIKEVMPEATQTMVDMATALGTDVSGGAVQLGKALNDPINGITALSRVGVSFTEQQKEQIKAMQEAGDMAGAQRVILAELNKEFGGSAAAAAAADGGLTQFKDRMGELAESIGARVLPALNAMLAWLNSPEVQAAITAVVDALMNGLGVAFTWISTVALPALQAAFTTVWPIIQGAVNVVYIFFSNVVFPFLREAFSFFTTTVLPDLQKAFEVVWPAIQSAVNAVYTFLQGTVWPWLQNTAFPWLQNVALPALRRVWEVEWKAITTAVTTTYTYLTGTVWPWLETALTNIGTWITTAKNTWSTAWSAISGAVTLAKDTMSGVIETIKGLVQGAIDKINALIGLVNSVPGINIPTIPGGSTGGGSGFGGRSTGDMTPLARPRLAATPGQHTTVNIDARNATDPRAVADNVRRALRSAGMDADIRLRTA